MIAALLAAWLVLSPVPVAIHIPSIGLGAAAEPGDVPGAPLNPDHVAWVVASAHHYVIYGHLDFRDPDGTPRLRTFSALRYVQIGDQIVLDLEDRSKRSYHVLWSERFVTAEVPAEALTPADAGVYTLAAITCAGDFDPVTHEYPQRRVVFAVQD